MNNKNHPDADVLKFLYLKYKAYVIPLVVILVSWFVFFRFIVPQIQSVLAAKSEVDASEQTIAIMTQNYNTLASLNDATLQNQLKLADTALPSEKDFAGILMAISNAAGASGAIVNDYSFQIGSLGSTTTSAAADADQTVELTLTLKGTMDQTKKFIQELGKQMPISEVISYSMIATSSISINANFFFSTMPKVTFAATQPISILTASQKKILTDLGSGPTTQAAVTPLPLPTLSPTPIASSTPSITPVLSATPTSSASSSL